MKNYGIAILLVAAAGGGAFMVKLMYDMTRQMELMTGHVASLSRDVSDMSRHVGAMAGHMERMDQTIYKGSENIQRWNPMQMVIPQGQGGR